MLYPEQNDYDEYYLMTNGSIFAPLHEPILLMPGVDYCMEIVPELGLRAFVCFLEGTKGILYESRNGETETVCSVRSSFRKSFTFCFLSVDGLFNLSVDLEPLNLTFSIYTHRKPVV